MGLEECDLREHAKKWCAVLCGSSYLYRNSMEIRNNRKLIFWHRYFEKIGLRNSGRENEKNVFHLVRRVSPDMILLPSKHFLNKTNLLQIYLL